MRKLFVFSLIFTILFAQVAYALPVLGTPGNADYVDLNSNINPDFYSVSRDDFKNTVSYKGISVALFYYDMSGRVKVSRQYLDSNYYFSIARPDDYVSTRALQFTDRKSVV